MRNTSLCYIEKDGAYLMLHRTKKENDENGGRWIGVGGGFEEGESPEECAAREIMEETGLAVADLSLRGIVTFVSDEWGTEYMYLFTARYDGGDVITCDEGDLEWVAKEKIPSLNLWEGDRIFLKLLAEDSPFFSLKLTYRGDELTG
ncbi:MAG: NUDIX domain-containing protein, partial [Clostridia bacterium]|nr:NUDIX domain-containing protein [Clostridia bacterium]